jgi:hypothetical protein
VAFYPEGTFYGHLHSGIDADRVVQHASRQEPLNDPPLQLPDGEREEHLRNIAELVRTLEGDRVQKRRWFWPFS